MNSGMNHAIPRGVREELKMFKEAFLRVEDIEANHRALRRCRSCGSYERPFEAFNGGVRCERCAKKARRRQEEERESEDLNVRFLV
jgi:hypothetical protein